MDWLIVIVLATVVISSGILFAITKSKWLTLFVFIGFSVVGFLLLCDRVVEIDECDLWLSDCGNYYGISESMIERNIA
jgi:hypothetical protein